MFVMPIAYRWGQTVNASSRPKYVRKTTEAKFRGCLCEYCENVKTETDRLLLITHVMHRRYQLQKSRAWMKQSRSPCAPKKGSTTRETACNAIVACAVFNQCRPTWRIWSKGKNDAGRDIDVSVDGTWQKRLHVGYNSLNGIVSAIACHHREGYWLRSAINLLWTMRISLKHG